MKNLLIFTSTLSILATITISLVVGVAQVQAQTEGEEARAPDEPITEKVQEPPKDKKLITTSDIAENAVTSPKIKDGEVKTSDIEDDTITGNDVSPSFMKRVTLKDDAAGNAKGWDPNNVNKNFAIIDDDISGSVDNISVNVNVQNPGAGLCTASFINVFNHRFLVECIDAQPSSAVLFYTITKLPAHVVTSSLSASSIPFDSLQGSQNVIPPSLP